MVRRGGGVWTAINNFPSAHAIVYEGKVEKWVPSSNGKTGKKNNLFPKEYHTQDQI